MLVQPRGDNRAGGRGALGNGVFSLTDASHPVKISQDNTGGLILIISPPPATSIK